MNVRVWRWLSVAFGVLIATVAWRLFAEGVFDSTDALDERASSLDAGVLEEWPFVDAGVEDEGDAAAEDGGANGALAGDQETPVPEAPSTEDGAGEDIPSLGIDGFARLGIDRLAVTDTRGRHVLRVRRAHASMRLTAMHDGVFRIPAGDVEGAEITLYRDEEGKISLAGALKTAQPTVQRSLGIGPVEKPESDNWGMEVGPITVKDVILTIGFTEKPVKFRIDRGVIRVRQSHEDAKPRIYFDEIEGALLEPSPLPKPVRIAFAKGLVRLEGRPMVELTARTCIGTSELRVRAVVPARKKPVELTGDSVGLGGALGRMGMKIAANKKSDKIHYQQGAVRLEEGPGCTDPPTRDAPADGGAEPEAPDASP